MEIQAETSPHPPVSYFGASDTPFSSAMKSDSIGT
jgi:hypothetical protein